MAGTEWWALNGVVSMPQAIAWLQQNDDKARAISKAARELGMQVGGRGMRGVRRGGAAGGTSKRPVFNPGESSDVNWACR